MARPKKGSGYEPKLRRHAGSGQGVVTLNGFNVYCGKWPPGDKNPPPEVSARYHQVIAEWVANGRQYTPPARPAPSGSSPTPASATAASSTPQQPTGPPDVAEVCKRYL